MTLYKSDVDSDEQSIMIYSNITTVTNNNLIIVLYYRVSKTLNKLGWAIFSPWRLHSEHKGIGNCWRTTERLQNTSYSYRCKSNYKIVIKYVTWHMNGQSVVLKKWLLHMEIIITHWILPQFMHIFTWCLHVPIRYLTFSLTTSFIWNYTSLYRKIGCSFSA